MISFVVQCGENVKIHSIIQSHNKPRKRSRRELILWNSELRCSAGGRFVEVRVRFEVGDDCGF